MNRLPLLAAAALFVLCGCAHRNDADVGVVDIARLTHHWPKFLNYENQFTADSQAVQTSLTGDAQARALDALQRRYALLQKEITGDVRDASGRVATQEKLKLVVTREFVGYGGRDVTAAVEKELGIVETPAPSASLAPIAPAASTPAATHAPTSTPAATSAPTPADTPAAAAAASPSLAPTATPATSSSPVPTASPKR